MHISEQMPAQSGVDTLPNYKHKFCTYIVEEELWLVTLKLELWSHHSLLSENPSGGFLGGPVVKNPLSSEGDTGLISGQGTKIPHVSGQLIPCHN